MAAPDRFHDVVKHALIKDGWTITDDPLSLDYGGVDYSIDFGAEKLIGAEKTGTTHCCRSQKFSQRFTHI